MESVINLLRKIKALADNGATDGEKSAANNRLQVLLKKHNLTIEDILEERVSDICFKYENEEQKSFLFQIIVNVLGKSKSIEKGVAMRSKSVYMSLTKPEEIDITEKYLFYWNDYNKKQKDFRAAYVHANDLGAPLEGEERTLSDDEKTDLLRILKLANSIEAASFYKKLGN